MRKGRLKGRSGQPALTWGKRSQHVHFKTRTVWQADPEEKPRGFADRSPFDSDKLPPLRHAPPPDLFCPPPRPRGLRLVTERVEIRVYAHRLVVRCQGEGEG